MSFIFFFPNVCLAAASDYMMKHWRGYIGVSIASQLFHLYTLRFYKQLFVLQEIANASKNDASSQIFFNELSGYGKGLTNKESLHAIYLPPPHLFQKRSNTGRNVIHKTASVRDPRPDTISHITTVCRLKQTHHRKAFIQEQTLPYLFRLIQSSTTCKK